MSKKLKKKKKILYFLLFNFSAIWLITLSAPPPDKLGKAKKTIFFHIIFKNTFSKY